MLKSSAAPSWPVSCPWRRLFPLRIGCRVTKNTAVTDNPAAAIGQRISRNTLWLFLARAGSQGLAVLFTILVARSLGEAGLGQYAFIAAVLFVGNTVSTFGLDTLIIREVAARRSAETSLLTAALWIQLALAALFILALLTGAQWLSGLSAATSSALKLYSFSLLPLAFSTVYNAALRGFERMDLVLLVNLVTAVLQTGGAFLILRAGGSLTQLIQLLLGVHLVSAVVAGRVCRRYLPDFSFRPHVKAALLWPTMRTGAILALLMILAVIYQRLGVFTLTWLGSEAQTGWFSAAARLVEAVKIVPYAFFGAVFPVMARSQWRSPAEQRLFRAALGGLAAFTAVAAAGLSLLAQPLILLLFGADYAPSIKALPILSWSLLPFVITLNFSFELVAGGREKTALRAMALTLAITAVLFPLLTERWGLIGACWAVTGSEAVQAVILWRMARSGASAERRIRHEWHESHE